MTVRKGVTAYPGHGAHPSPPQGPRVKAEGEPNYIKAKGTIKQRLFDDKAPLIVEAQPVSRCPSSAGTRNFKHGWNGTIPALLNGTATPRPNTAPPRVKPEALGTVEIGRGKRMKVIVNEYAKSGPTPREPRVKPEAAATAQVHKGGRMHNLLHKYGSQPMSARAVPRVKPEAETNFEAGKGRRMHDSIHFYGQKFLVPKPEPRVKPEAEANADLDKGKRMKQLMVKYGRDPLNSNPAPRVKTDGRSNADLDRGVRMSRLLHEPRSVPVSPTPLPRTNTSQARENALKGRGSMDSVLNQIGKTTFVYRPGVQSRSYTRASIA